MASNPLNIDATKGSLFGKILMFALPLAAIYLSNSIFNAVDLSIAGFDSYMSLAAIGSTNAITNLMLIPVMGLGCGALVMAARHRGAGDDDGVSRAIHVSLVLAFFGGLVLMVSGAVLARPLMMALRTPDDLMDPATSYLRLSSLSFPFTAVATVCVMLMYGLGDMLLPVFILLMSGIVRIGLSFVFVRFFRMEAAGLALAALISQPLAAALLLLILAVSGGPERIKWSGIRNYACELGLIAAIGVPVMIQSAALAFTNVAVAARINSLGLTVIAGNTVAGMLETTVHTLFVIGMYRAAMVFVGQNSGAGKYDRVLKGTLICALLATVALVLSCAAGLIFGERLLGFINPAPEAIKQAMLRLYVTLPVFFLCGLMDVFTGALIGLGKWWAAVASGVALLGICVFRIIWVFAVFPQFRSLRVLMISYPLSWGIVALVNGAIFFLVIGLLISGRRRTEAGRGL